MSQGYVHDFVLNGQGHGPVGDVLDSVSFDPGLLRPYYDDDGVKCVTMNSGEFEDDPETGQQRAKKIKRSVRELRNDYDMDVSVWNATTLRQKQWVRMQDRVIQVARTRLRALTDLANMGGTIGGFDGMSVMTYEYEMASDSGEALQDMEGVADSRHDEPLQKLASIPLPITHSGYHYSRRRLAVSGRNGTPLNLRSAENSGRRVAEMLEDNLIGTVTGITYGTQTAGPGTHEGTSTVYGYTNFPYRTTKTDLTAPTGTNPEAVMTDVLEMIELLQADNFFGPYVLYVSTGYSRYLSDDYFRTGSTSAVRTLRERLMEIEGITDIRRLDRLTSGYQMILVQMGSDTAQLINGMDINTIQWETRGGNLLMFRTWAIQVPLLFRDYDGDTAIVHGTTS